METPTTMPVLVFAFLLACPAVGFAAQKVNPPPDVRVGPMHLAKPDQEPRALLFLVSGSNGWTKALDQAADALAANGYGVAGVDLTTWVAGLATDPPDADCHYVVGDLEDAGKFVQRRWNSQTYRHGVVLGLGAGGTLAIRALANAPANTLAGAIAIDAADELRSRLPLCPASDAVADGDRGFSYEPPTALQGWFVDARWHKDASNRDWVATLPRTRSIEIDPRMDLPAAIARAAKAGTALAGEAPGADATLADLPLVELPVNSPNRTFAVILSGDGGWRDIDQSLASVFVANGLPAVGLDSLRYFWTRHEPATIAADVDRIIRHYQEKWGTDRVALVGFSFGADVLPAVWPLLSEDTRRAVVQVSLLALSLEEDFEFRVTGWVGWDQPDSKPVAPDLVRMDAGRTQCFYGADDGQDETGCLSPQASGFELIERPGGHHFDGDYETIANMILAGLKRRGGGAW